MPTWPASLPQKQFIGLTEEIQDPVLRTQMDAGPETRRKRYTAVVREVTVPLVLRGDDKQTFDTFFSNDIGFGAFSFDWEDPVTDVTKRFAFKQPPRWTMAQGGAPNQRIWKTSLELKILP